MIRTTQLSGRGWVNLFDEFSIDPGTPLVIHNPNTYYIEINTDSDPEATNDPNNLIKIEHNQSARSSYLNDYLWARGDGYCSVTLALENEVTSQFQVVDLPHDLYTSNEPKYRRLRVDPGQTSFFEGREFRFFHEFSIADGSNDAIKFVVPEDVILWNISIELDGGSVRILTLADTAGNPVTETDPVTDAVTVVRKNNMSLAPVISSGVAVTNGGTVDGGEIIDIHRFKSANAGWQRTTVGGRVGEERGVSPGTYYLKLESTGNGTATGVISGWWEENVFS